MLKAYVVDGGDSDNDYDFHESCLVYHETQEAARELGRRALSFSPSFGETRAERAPEHDERATQVAEPQVEDNLEYLRSKRWRMEGESACCCCGLAAFGFEQYAVCRVSNQCKGCGCDDEDTPEDDKCDHRDGFSCE